MIELNADLAEGAAYDQQILGLVQRANVCLGVHAGSPSLTSQTIEVCAERGVRCCAHPGYPDRDGFGRRPYQVAGLGIDVVRRSLVDQTSDLDATFECIKPHGAFYNEACEPGPIVDILIEILSRTKLALVGLPGTAHAEAARLAGVPFIPEAFADRGYAPDGRLIKRSEPGAFLTVDEMKEVLADRIASARTLCVHGDGEDPVERLTVLGRELERLNVEVKPWTP